MSKTKQAIAMMKDEGVTAYRAAKMMKITNAAVYAELARQRKMRVCEACGSKVKIDAGAVSAVSEVV